MGLFPLFTVAFRSDVLKSEYLSGSRCGDTGLPSPPVVNSPFRGGSACSALRVSRILPLKSNILKVTEDRDGRSRTHTTPGTDLDQQASEIRRVAQGRLAR